MFIIIIIFYRAFFFYIFEISPLHSAVNNGYFEIVKFLIENNANYLQLDDKLFSILHKAAYNGYYSICEYLIKTGIDINIIDRFSLFY